jgi:hypothetical protein
MQLQRTTGRRTGFAPLSEIYDFFNFNIFNVIIFAFRLSNETAAMVQDGLAISYPVGCAVIAMPNLGQEKHDGWQKSTFEPVTAPLRKEKSRHPIRVTDSDRLPIRYRLFNEGLF